MGTLWGREPALILGVVQAVLAVAISFGVDLTPQQVGMILAATAAVLALITRQRVTPTPDRPGRHEAQETT